MSEWIAIFALTFASGFAMVLGALIASVEKISRKWLGNELRHSVIAFGGGILISAVALVLVQEGMKSLPTPIVVLTFASGGVAFMGIDLFLSRMHTNASQLAAMLLDFVPEALALGALYSLDVRYAFLLAVLIFFQNLPEGFNAYLEICRDSNYRKKTVIGLFFAASFLGPIAGLSGYFFLSDFPELLAGIMLFASGGILYLVFQDIAPQAKIADRWAPAIGAVGGFCVGLLGKMLLGH